MIKDKTVLVRANEKLRAEKEGKRNINVGKCLDDTYV